MWWPALPIGRRAFLATALAASAMATAFAQSTPPPAQLPAQPAIQPSAVFGGQGEFALQGFYMGGNGQALLNTTGTDLHFQMFLPSVGLLSGNLEAYGSQNRFQTGQNFLELRGASWMGRHWTLTGGDFRTPATMVEFPFTNIFNPEIDGRGFKIEAANGTTQYTLFYGQETLTAGTRVAYRIMTPQTVAGALVVRKLARNWQMGLRLMQFSTSRQSISDNPYLFPPGRTTPLQRTMALQTSYTPISRLKFYAEASRPVLTGAGNVTSMLAGAAWEGARFSWKANYVYQGINYFPLAGYYSGDRRGPYAEARFHPWKRFELFASASQYSNNLERDPGRQSLTSASVSAGASLLLPGGFSTSGSISKVSFAESGGGLDPLQTRNRQLNASLARTIRRHTLHADWREITISSAPSAQRQRSWEAGDNFQIKHFALGGSVRYQQAAGLELRNSLFFRGQGQFNAGRFSAYANIEVGNDLANKTLFATDAYNTSVAGVGLRLGKGWNLQGETFRSRLNLALNPESVFLLQNEGAFAGLSPATLGLSDLSQWSVYFRLSKQLHWGAGLPSGNTDQFIAKAVPLVGEIEGAVKVKALNAVANAAGIAVSLDGGRTVITGPNGYYRFPEVAEGAHEVAISLPDLPADYDPGDPQKARVTVQPRHSVRADLQVLPLVALTGKVTGPEGADLDGIIIRMAPGNRYTSTRADGSFFFYNVHEGDFELVLDATSLPEGAELASDGVAPVVVRLAARIAAVQFKINMRTAAAKPIRKVLDKK